MLQSKSKNHVNATVGKANGKKYLGGPEKWSGQTSTYKKNPKKVEETSENLT